jgi:sulfatase maturation enzyme AslB (radical SAM superfamily)
MLNGIPRSECDKCYHDETAVSNGNKRLSMRQRSNMLYTIPREKCTEEFDSVRYIEMPVDNICNLECKMCNSKFSSKLQSRDKFLGDLVYKKLEPNFNKFDNIDISKVTHVKILGGEPFITPNFIKFIDYLIERVNATEVTVEIATNGTCVPDKEIIEKLNLFKNLDIGVSLDSFDKSNDYQRYGGSYLETFNNAILYRTIFKNVLVYTHSVVTLLNANTLGNTINKLEKHFSISIDFLRDPKELSVLCAPKQYLDWIVESNSHSEKASLMINSIIKRNTYDEKLWNDFLNSIKKLDNYYKVELKDFNQPLANFLLNFK